MKQLSESVRPATLRNMRALVACASVSVLAMACSFGDVDQDPEIEVPDSTTVVPPAGEVAAPGTSATPGNTTAPAAPADPNSVSNQMAAVSGDANYVATNLDANALGILAANCGSCHANGAALGNFGKAESIAEMVNAGMIVPGDPENSRVLIRMKAGNMPPAYIDDQRPTTGDIDLVEQWIVALNGGGGACDALPFLSVDAMWEAIQQDFNQVDVDDQPFTRYLTTSYSSNAGECGTSFENQKWALFKAINSVSTNPRATPARQVDEAGMIWSIDLRNYNFQFPIQFDIDNGAGVTIVDATDKWEAVVQAAQPYAVEYQGDQADAVKAGANTLVPVMPLDAFIQFATQGDLYYELVDQEVGLIDFEATIGVDRFQNFDRGAIWRAGLRTSGVSQQDRSLTRQDSNFGAYWLSFDFAGNNGNESIFSDPVNFQFAGGEAIYNLPNGLQAYRVDQEVERDVNGDGVVDAIELDGVRLTEAPEAVVVDPNQNNGTVINSSSCHSCHQAGIIPFQDQVKAFVANNPNDFNAQDIEDVERFFPADDVFAEVSRADSERHINALERAGIPRDKIADTVSRVFVKFQLGGPEGGLDLATVAGQLNVTPETLQAQLPRLGADFSQLAGQGRLEREALTEGFFDALCILQAPSENQPVGCQ